METITMKKIEELPPIYAEKNDIVKAGKIPFFIKMIRIYFRIIGNVFPAFAAKQAFNIFQTPRIRAKHKTSDATLEKAQLFEILYGGQILKGYEWGKREDPAILLVHGWESRGTAMRSLVDPLLNKGFRVVTFDGPAHGNSGGKKTNMPDFAGAINALINHTGEVYGIIGHSFGGAASIFTMKYIDPKISLEKFVMVGTPSKIVNVFKRFGDFLHIPNKVLLEVHKIIEKLMGASIHNMDNTIAMDEMKIKKALIVHDKQDSIVPFEDGKETAMSWDNARLLATDGYGHFKLLKKPDVIAKIVGFISE